MLSDTESQNNARKNISLDNLLAKCNIEKHSAFFILSENGKHASNLRVGFIYP